MSNSENLPLTIFCWILKNILLVLMIEEISLLPDLSSPPLLRIQWEWSERDARRKTEDILVSNIE
jgi:hypothetical protein